MGRAIVRHPQVYLMDEPLSNLDAKLRVQTRTELVELQQRLAVTTVYVTHDQVEAMTMGHRVAVLRDGNLQQCDAPSTLYHAPANLFVAGFIGSPAMNMLPVSRERAARGSPGAEIGVADDLGGERATIGFRPETVVVGRGADSRPHPHRRGSRLRGLRPPGDRPRGRASVESSRRSPPRSPGRPGDNVRLRLQRDRSSLRHRGGEALERHGVTTVLVTGAAGDIGTAVAEVLAGRGHRLALADHPDAGPRLAETVQLCRRLGADAEGVTFDVTDEAAVTAAVHELGSSPGGLVNNAGYQGLFRPVDSYPLEDARRVVEVNVLGALTVLAAVSRAMVEAGAGGSIVNIASMAGVSGAPNMPAYSASKAAVIGLTKAAAKDLAPHGIRVNAVSPAFVGPGRMWETQVALQAAAGSQYYATDPDAVAEQMIGMVPLRRYGSVLEVANVVSFLLSDDASYVTGVNLEVSGGST